MNKDSVLNFIFCAMMLVIIFWLVTVLWLLTDIRYNTERIVDLLHLNNKITNDVLIEVTNGFNKR